MPILNWTMHTWSKLAWNTSQNKLRQTREIMDSPNGRFSDHSKKKSGTRLKSYFKLHLNLKNCSTFGAVFFIYVIFVGDFGHFVKGQTSSSANNSTLCVCGVDRVPCAKSVTSSDCPNGRVISRRDCPCCFLCAKQLTDECNSEELLCDSDYGLECGSDKRCKGEISFRYIFTFINCI